MAQGLLRVLGRGGQPWRVVKAAVNDPGAAWKGRTGLVGVATDGDHLVKGEVLHGVQGFGPLRREVDADLSHDPDRQGVQGFRVRPRRVGVDAIPF